jgi:hypothetical protein
MLLFWVTLLIICLYLESINQEHFNNESNIIHEIESDIFYSRNSNCAYMMNATLSNVLEKNNIQYNQDIDKWSLYFPCTYNNIDEEIRNIHPNIENLENRRYFIIDNADEVSSKDQTWKNLVLMYGRDIASSIMPMTYVLYDSPDIDLFKKEYRDGDLFILKKNIQRQEGLKITNDKNTVLNGFNDNYIIAQKLLQDPYLINGRKINMRFYLLLVCNKGHIEAYVHHEGFMYYTKELFVKNNDSIGVNVTTGYIDRKIYQENPLTHGDFRRYLDDPDRKISDIEKNIKTNHLLSRYVFDKIYFVLRQTVLALESKICKGKLKSYITFQLFGVDIAVSDTFNINLMEINKGPDMGAKDDRDYGIKYLVTEDVLRIIGAITTGIPSFRRIV